MMAVTRQIYLVRLLQSSYHQMILNQSSGLLLLLLLVPVALCLPNQLPFYPPPPELQGWFDPRINGGRLLDVRASTIIIYRVLISSLVYQSSLWRTIKRYYHRKVGPIHSHRKRPPYLRQVRISSVISTLPTYLTT